jgi:peptide/nickel transport system permease protein
MAEALARSDRINRRRPLPPSLVVGATVLALVSLLAVFAPAIAPFDFEQLNIRQRLQPPDYVHWLGTDEYGRDVWSRVLFGSRLSLLLGISATGVSLVLGVPLGLASGFFRGKFDEISMRILDILMAFPPIVLMLLVVSVTEPAFWKTALIVGFLGLPSIARTTRSVTLGLANEDFITAAKARGESRFFILFGELLPNAWAPIIVEGSLRVTFAILAAAVLSFLGFGVQPPAADWGLMISQARGYLSQAPWIALAPGLAMCITVVAVNLIGDGLREYLDPKSNRLA